MQFHMAEEPNEIDAIVCDECEFVFDDSLGELPVVLPLRPG
jgi:hypothetical protein